jgi:hypothetical protein
MIGNFVKGLGSAIFQVGTLKEILSSAVADGIENGINRATPLLMKNLVRGAVFFTGVFLVGLGIAKWMEALLVTPGVGYIFAGLVLLIAGSVTVYARK